MFWKLFHVHKTSLMASVSLSTACNCQTAGTVGASNNCTKVHGWPESPFFSFFLLGSRACSSKCYLWACGKFQRDWLDVSIELFCARAEPLVPVGDMAAPGNWVSSTWPWFLWVCHSISTRTWLWPSDNSSACPFHAMLASCAEITALVTLAKSAQHILKSLYTQQQHTSGIRWKIRL